MSQANTDNGGRSVRLSQVTLLTNIDWLKILKENINKEIHLCTYGCPDGEKMRQAVSHIANGKIIIGTRQPKQDWNILKTNSNVKVRYNSHAKLLLIYPKIVYLSSQNIEFNDLYQTSIRIEDSVAYEYYLNQFNEQWTEDNPKKEYYKNKSILNPKYTQKVCSFSGDLMNVNKTEVTLKNCDSKLATMKNWKTKLTGIRNSYVIITTQRMPHQEYVCECLDLLLKNNDTVTLIVNDKPELVQNYMELYPKITIYHCMNIHSKMLIHDNQSVWLSSQNFGNSGEDWFECAIQLRNEKACHFYKKRLEEFLNISID